MRRIAPIIVLAVLLVGSNLYWFYRMMDIGISNTYREASFDTLRNSYDAAIGLANLNLIGMSADEAIETVFEAEVSEAAFEKSDGCLYVSEVCLQLDESRTVIEIRK